MIEKIDYKKVLPEVVELANQAASEIMAIYSRDFSVETKGDSSPLTEADLASHRKIIAGLERMTPDIPILSEESAKIPFSERSTWGTYWLVDPLDGTREFIKRNGEFTVNIALIHGKDAVLGVVVVPVTQVSYFACLGHGSYRQEPGKIAQQIKVKAYDPNHVLIAGSRSHGSDALNDFLKKVGKHEYVGMGSSLKLCLVAEGKVDIYPRLGLTSEWDTAAAQCIVEEAGGFMSDTQLQPLKYNTKDSLLNPFFLVIADKSADWGQYFINE